MYSFVTVYYTGINAVVSTGVSLMLQDKLAVNGTLTFQNNASLIQINDVANMVT
jgi:hypothetical protein